MNIDAPLSENPPSSTLKFPLPFVSGVCRPCLKIFSRVDGSLCISRMQAVAVPTPSEFAFSEACMLLTKILLVEVRDILRRHMSKKLVDDTLAQRWVGVNRVDWARRGSMYEIVSSLEETPLEPVDCSNGLRSPVFPVCP